MSIQCKLLGHGIKHDVKDMICGAHEEQRIGYVDYLACVRCDFKRQDITHVRECPMCENEPLKRVIREVLEEERAKLNVTA